MPTQYAPASSRNLAEILWRAADARAAHPLVIHRAPMAFDTVRAHAAAVAARLREAGLRPGDRAAIFLDRGAVAVSAYFGVLAAGGVATFINERFRARQAEYVLEHAGARLLLTTAEMLERLPRAITGAPTIIDVAAIEAGAEFEPVPRADTDLAQIIYTSGSTGMPKGVMVTHGGLGSGIVTVASYLGIQPDDRTASLLPFSSVYGLNQMLCCVLTGSTLLVELSPVPQQLVTNLRAAGVTVLAAVPPLWIQLIGAPAFRDERIPSLRVLQNAGGHLPVPLVKAVRRAQPHARLFLQYGMTETFRGTFLPPEEVDAHPDSMGRPIPGAEMVVVSEEGAICGPGEVGELVHAGPTVAAGYWNDPEGTARVFRQHPLRPDDPHARAVYSGDMVKWDDEGRLIYVSRRDRMIKTLGFRVGPDEILDVLHASGQVSEAVIVTEPDPQRGMRIIAVVVLAPGGSAERLRWFCRAELPRHLEPARIVVRSSIPRMPSGKYDLAAAAAGD